MSNPFAFWYSVLYGASSCLAREYTDPVGAALTTVSTISAALTTLALGVLAGAALTLSTVAVARSSAAPASLNSSETFCVLILLSTIFSTASTA